MADEVRNLAVARSAYSALDRDESMAAHMNAAVLETEEGHSEHGDMVKSIVYGGLDGVLTTFAIISGASGGHFTPKVVFVLGISNILADAISMGVGDALSSIAHQEHVLSEYERVKKSVSEGRAAEIESLVDTYVKKGLPRDKARVVVNTVAKYNDIFVELLMVEKLGLQLPEDDENAWYDGLITFVSFTVFGVIPLSMYSFAPIIYPGCSHFDMFLVACAATGVVLFLLGVVTSCITTGSGEISARTWKELFFPCIAGDERGGKHWFQSGFEFLFMGGAVAVVAYFLGAFVEYIGHTYLSHYLHGDAHETMFTHDSHMDHAHHEHHRDLVSYHNINF
eukprot:g736.t1